jgi:hypothetical protein
MYCWRTVAAALRKQQDEDEKDEEEVCFWRFVL